MSNAAEQQYAEQGIVYLDPKMRIKNYWTQRSHSFAELRVRELNSIMADRWLREIAKYIPAGGQLRILDIGTGTGFFAFLLSSLGHRVTGIDLTPSMIQEAKEIGQTLESTAQFRVMDAEKLLFADESFDMVISRNLTWTLPHPQEAYREWQRVLKPGGVLLNFDGNYGKADFTGKGEKLPENHAHKQITGDLMQECEAIKDQLEISYHVRPAWDVTALGETGFEQIRLDLGISKRIYIEKDEFYNPTPLFCIAATKNQI